MLGLTKLTFKSFSAPEGITKLSIVPLKFGKTYFESTMQQKP